MKKFIPLLTILLGLVACKKDDVKTSNKGLIDKINGKTSVSCYCS